MRRKLTYRELRFLDGIDWPKWAVLLFVALVIFGGLFEASHHDPWFAVVVLLVLGAILIPMRLRELHRRIDEYEALPPRDSGTVPSEPIEPPRKS